MPGLGMVVPGPAGVMIVVAVAFVRVRAIAGIVLAAAIAFMGMPAAALVRVDAFATVVMNAAVALDRYSRQGGRRR